MNQRLQGRSHVVGNTLTLADLTLAASLMYATQTDVPLAELPNVLTWFSAIAALEPWKKTGG